LPEGNEATGRPAPGRHQNKVAPRLSDDVYAELKKKILAGAIAGGERLYETVVAQDFVASRTPVREALMRLFEEGLLERRGRAYTVPELSPPELIDLYVVRQKLEVLSVSLAARSANETLLGKLQRNINMMENALRNQDRLSFNAIDSEFHMFIAESTMNKYLTDALFNIHQKLLVRNSFEHFIERFPAGNEEHLLIVNALRRRDPGVAAAEMESHIQGAINFLRSLPQLKASTASEQE
jgi:DNA-binding GntR family transcriptional regulator